MSYRLCTGLDSGLHPDEVAAAADMLRACGVELGPDGEDAVARALLSAQAWRLRQAADEARHARLRDDPGRLAEIKRGL